MSIGIKLPTIIQNQKSAISKLPPSAREYLRNCQAAHAIEASGAKFIGGAISCPGGKESVIKLLATLKTIGVNILNFLKA